MTGAFPPGEWSISLSSIHNVMGVAYAAPSKVAILKPAAVLSDPSLETVETQAIALYAGVLSGSPGQVVLQQTYSGCGIGAVLGLGAGSASSSLRVRHRFVCPGPTPQDARVTVVAADGASASVACECAQASQDQTVALPGQGPWVLVVDHLAERPLPCWAGFIDDVAAYELEEFELLN